MHFNLHLNLSANGENHLLLGIICKAAQWRERMIVSGFVVFWLSLFTLFVIHAVTYRVYKFIKIIADYTAEPGD